MLLESSRRLRPGSAQAAIDAWVIRIRPDHGDGYGAAVDARGSGNRVDRSGVSRSSRVVARTLATKVRGELEDVKQKVELCVTRQDDRIYISNLRWFKPDDREIALLREAGLEIPLLIRCLSTSDIGLLD